MKRTTNLSKSVIMIIYPHIKVIWFILLFNSVDVYHMFRRNSIVLLKMIVVNVQKSPIKRMKIKLQMDYKNMYK